MKKLLTTFVVSGLLTLSSNAQNAIPNPGFENWDTQTCPEPISWGTINGSTCIVGVSTVTKATAPADVHSGSFAVKLETIFIGFPINQTAPGIAATGTINTQTNSVDGGIVYNLRPDSITGWYKYAPATNDTASVEITLSKWNTSTNQRDKVGYAEFIQTNMVNAYTYFKAAITYSLPDNPDTAVVILLSSSSGNPQDGSILFIDDLNLIIPALSSSATSSNALCNGVCSGTATATVVGGTVPYTYSWSTNPVQTSATATALCAGSYTVTVTDAVGDSSTATVTIAEPSAIVFVTNSSGATCGQANGSVSVSSSGGTGAHAYLWNDPGSSTTNSVNGLTSGSYTVTITDSNGCTATATQTVSGTPAVNLITNKTDPSSCGATDGSATVTVSSGTAPYNYSWNTNPVQTNATAANLSSGTYTVQVTDINGCTQTANVTLNDPGSPSISISDSSMVSCFGGNDGSATVSASGGAFPYTYSWSGGTTPNNATTSGLAAGTYSVTVTDNTGCTASTNVSITQPSALQIGTPSVSDITCFGDSSGAVNITVTGGTVAYTYNWFPGWQTTQNINNLSGGTYSVLVNDANGCMDSASVNVAEPAVLSLSVSAINESSAGAGDGSATVSPSGGTQPYSYTWNDAFTQTTATATGLPAGTYTATVYDNKGCFDTISVAVGVGTGITDIEFSSSINFYPNPGTGEFTLEFALKSELSAVIDIVAINGENIYHEEIKNPKKSIYSKNININGKAKGIYLLTVRQGKWVMKKKIVIG